ncbi:hypothetical protein F6453_2347 [Marinobacter nauticus]|uniref:Uncharacterized protein n=1 Tax=Marinobacter nauticus TaxID=2743 RepID=A0A833NAQ2_MARNT|nr:hypothetical protein F6453_2347 [Marinobacter nauticus]
MPLAGIVHIGQIVKAVLEHSFSLKELRLREKDTPDKD